MKTYESDQLGEKSQSFEFTPQNGLTKNAFSQFLKHHNESAIDSRVIEEIKEEWDEEEEHRKSPMAKKYTKQLVQDWEASVS